jgi:type 2 lantibiotic biosynthesis protein LanM
VNADNFDTSLGCLVGPALDEVATHVRGIAGIHAPERDVILGAAQETLLAVLHAKVSRVLVLELNAARVMGRLTGTDPQERWAQFLDFSSHRHFWDDLSVHYPSLLARIDTIVRNRCAATLCFARRWATDRPRLASLCGNDPGELREVHFGAGDSHHKGESVAVLRSDAGRIVYKPRSLAVDLALDRFVTELAEDHDSPLCIRVPKAVGFDEHGWVEFVAHRYASAPDELRDFYEGIGHWLAIMRLLGGNDLHAENLIAEGKSPVIVDCETLFTPRIPPSPSGYGRATDRATEIVAGTVLSTGLLPGRGAALGWRGVDNSAVGMLPGEQPVLLLPSIVKGGSDEARIGNVPTKAPMSQNHPSPQPALEEYWSDILNGFAEMTETLRRVDTMGVLRPRLERFADCRIRVVPRPTETYSEIGRMLWHPVSLHNEERARKRAFDLLLRMSANVSVAPNDPEVINAEIDDLMAGDIPFFSTLVKDGRLKGPGSTHWLPLRDVIDSTLQHWRTADFGLEHDIIRASILSAYANERWPTGEVSFSLADAHHGNLDSRRRQQAQQIVRGIIASAILGNDGSAAWIAPVVDETGWSVRPMAQDLYNGMSGIALLMGAYLRETRSGRVEPVEGVEEVYKAALHTLHLSDEKLRKLRGEGLKIRPRPPGGYIGIASQIWTYLTLAHWELDSGDGLQRAHSLAVEALPESVEADEMYDVLGGTAGAIVPLLALAQRTGEERHLRMASQLGDRVCERAQRKDNCAYWSNPNWPDGIGGFAHGVTGIGWALAKVAGETGNERHKQTALAALSFEEGLFDEAEQNWRDLRGLDNARTKAAWCHGAVGIGLAHLDLDPTLANRSTQQILRRAVAATWRLALGWNHCVCHGDFGAWELLERAMALGKGPKNVTAVRLRELLLTNLEKRGPSASLASDTFGPGLMPGWGGVAYQLLRMHPESDLPSLLTLGASL